MGRLWELCTDILEFRWKSNCADMDLISESIEGPLFKITNFMPLIITSCPLIHIEETTAQNTPKTTAQYVSRVQLPKFPSLR